MINTLRYNYATKKLVITFYNNSQYTYEDVPPEIFAQVTSAESVGKAFNARIKNQYSCYKTVSANGQT